MESIAESGYTTISVGMLLVVTALLALPAMLASVVVGIIMVLVLLSIYVAQR